MFLPTRYDFLLCFLLPENIHIHINVFPRASDDLFRAFETNLFVQLPERGGVPERKRSGESLQRRRIALADRPFVFGKFAIDRRDLVRFGGILLALIGYGSLWNKDDG